MNYYEYDALKGCLWHSSCKTFISTQHKSSSSSWFKIPICNIHNSSKKNDKNRNPHLLHKVWTCTSVITFDSSIYTEKCWKLISEWLQFDEYFFLVFPFGGWTFFMCRNNLIFSGNVISQRTFMHYYANVVRCN